MQKFGINNGVAKKTARDILKAINFNKISIVDERHRIKHKDSNKKAYIQEIQKIWKILDQLEIRKGSLDGSKRKISPTEEELEK